MRRAVVFCLVTPDGKVLLERKPAGHPNEPGSLVLPGGLVEEHETPEQSIARELNEEYGIRDPTLVFHPILEDEDYRAPGGQHFEMAYFVVLGWNGTFTVRNAAPSELYGWQEAFGHLNARRRTVLKQALECQRRYRDLMSKKPPP